jgi:hypothetical protein
MGDLGGCRQSTVTVILCFFEVTRGPGSWHSVVPRHYISLVWTYLLFEPYQ